MQGVEQGRNDGGLAWAVVYAGTRAYFGVITGRKMGALTLSPAYELHEQVVISAGSVARPRLGLPIAGLVSATSIEVVPTGVVDDLSADDRSHFNDLAAKAEELRASMARARAAQRAGIIIAQEVPNVPGMPGASGALANGGGHE